MGESAIMNFSAAEGLQELAAAESVVECEVTSFLRAPCLQTLKA